MDFLALAGEAMRHHIAAGEEASMGVMQQRQAGPNARRNLVRFLG